MSDSGCFAFLFELPTEIRFTIYEYALTEETDLECLPLEPSDPPVCFTLLKYEKDGRKHQRNQLQFVSRALRKETKGLSLKFNGLLFVSRDHFYAFLRLSSPYWQGQMRHITIAEMLMSGPRQVVPSFLTDEEAQPLYDFALENPKARIIVHYARRDCVLKLDLDVSTVYAVWQQFMEHDADLKRPILTSDPSGLRHVVVPWPFPTNGFNISSPSLLETLGITPIL